MNTLKLIPAALLLVLTIAGCSSGSGHAHETVAPEVQAASPGELAQKLAGEFQQVPEADREAWVSERRLSLDQLALSADPAVKAIYDQNFAPYTHR